MKVPRAVYMCSILAACLVWVSVLASARSSFSDYDDIHLVLASLADILPPALKSSDLSARRKAWPDWVIGHDRDIRARLLRGDDDTIVNWLLFGTSFTRQPRASLDALSPLISMRAKDLISALASADPDERKMFARRLLLSKGYGFDTIEKRARLERHLLGEVARVAGEQQQYTLKIEAAVRANDVAREITEESRLFRDRGLSLDTSILPGFAIEKALETMKDQRLLPPGGIRRVAVIGPGLDFADKNSGYDFYPVQTLQPFTSIDSLVRLGLAARPAEIEITTFDISPHVNDHILALRDRAKVGAPYALLLPIDLGLPWTPALVSYWKSIGDRIGSETRIPRPPAIDKSLELRGIEVRAQVAAGVTPVDFNVLTEKWTGPPFDLVIATNVLIYYDRLDQALAFAGIEAMLRPGGFFLTNNAVVELPVSRLRSVGFVTVEYTTAAPLKSDHVFWYRRNVQ